MSQVIFKGQTINVVSSTYPLQEDGMVQVEISGVADGADVLTTYLDEVGNSVTIVTLSLRSSASETLPAPPAAIGGYDYTQKRRLQFKVENAGALTDINMSVTASYGPLKKEN